MVCLSNAKSSYCPCPVLVCIWAYFGIPVALNYKYILRGSLCYDAIKLLVELIDLLLFMTVMLCCLTEIQMEMSLLERRVQLILYHECHPILVFQVVSAKPGLVSLICGSFSKSCPFDFGKAQAVPSILF